MANQFCKILEVQDHQVLIRIGTNDDNEEAIILTTQIDGLEMTAFITEFKKNKTTPEEQFSKLGQEYAEHFFKSMYNLTQA
ncbi:hypothetical protein [Flavobacterium sp. UMI-01]|uniref:hypothetical protein n=1 Tax=Flavobacterium sp. UMI-01 TaxID=1441053 RepID=UPI001C7CCA91|nr:hypothetical protein [Flavobacterium sp. UMI-01]GIZ10010.1 hypothetical protein FUMI01_27360 [Flavobacterium sp. UMI-01]